VGDVILELEY